MEKFANKGFSLVELIIVLSISLIMMSVASFIPDNNEKRELNKVALQIQNDLRLAQRLAIFTGKNYRVTFDTNNDLYMIRMQDDSVFGGYKTIKTVNIQDNIDLFYANINGSTSVTYTPLGSTGNACTITLMSKSYMLQLTINVGSGRIDIKEFVKV